MRANRRQDVRPRGDGARVRQVEAQRGRAQMWLHGRRYAAGQHAGALQDAQDYRHAERLDI